MFCFYGLESIMVHTLLYGSNPARNPGTAPAEAEMKLQEYLARKREENAEKVDRI